MSIQATHQDAIDVASRQVSLAEFQSSSCEDLGEPIKAKTEESFDLDQRDDIKGDLDYSQSVVVSENGNRYHAIQYSICACPHVHGTEITLAEAVERGKLPCGVCEPVDYRREQPDTQPATVEAFQ